MTAKVHPQEVTYIEAVEVNEDYQKVPVISKKIYYKATGQEAMEQLRKERPDVTIIGAGRVFGTHDENTDR